MGDSERPVSEAELNDAIRETVAGITVMYLALVEALHTRMDFPKELFHESLVNLRKTDLIETMMGPHDAGDRRLSLQVIDRIIEIMGSTGDTPPTPWKPTVIDGGKRK